MVWRVAKSLHKLRRQIDEAYPDRSKASDGTIGDARHASSVSDHNPHIKDGRIGVVTALDITHDLESGCDGTAIARALTKSRDVRIKYLIWNKRMVSSYPAHGFKAWEWRPYSGSNPHTRHLHISVKGEKSLYDSEMSWMIESEDSRPRTHTVKPGDTLSGIALNYLGSASLYPRIMEANKLDSTVIKVGQVLVIP